MRVVLFKTSESRLLESRILFLGGGPLAKECADLASNNDGYHKYDMAGFVPMPDRGSCAVPSSSLLRSRGASRWSRWRASTTSRKSWSRCKTAAAVLPDPRNCSTASCNGIKVTDSATFFEREACQIRVDSLQPSWLVFGGGFDQGFVRTLRQARLRPGLQPDHADRRRCR